MLTLECHWDCCGYLLHNIIVTIAYRYSYKFKWAKGVCFHLQGIWKNISLFLRLIVHSFIRKVNKFTSDWWESYIQWVQSRLASDLLFFLTNMQTIALIFKCLPQHANNYINFQMFTLFSHVLKNQWQLGLIFKLV